MNIRFSPVGRTNQNRNNVGFKGTVVEAADHIVQGRVKKEIYPVKTLASDLVKEIEAGTPADIQTMVIDIATMSKKQKLLVPTKKDSKGNNALAGKVETLTPNDKTSHSNAVKNYLQQWKDKLTGK